MYNITLRRVSEIELTDVRVFSAYYCGQWVVFDIDYFGKDVYKNLFK